MIKVARQYGEKGMAGGVRKKILLTGTCWYELSGLYHLLSAQEFDVDHALTGESDVRREPDLIIVALSAEPVAGWGRHLSRVRTLRTNIAGKMLVLVPEKLKKLNMLQNTCQVYSGCGSVTQLSEYISGILTDGERPAGEFLLTEGQSRALKRLSDRGRDRPLSLKPGERDLYYHYARLASNVGVKNFRMLLMAGLDREIHEAEGRLCGQ